MTKAMMKRDGGYLESCPVVYSLNLFSKKWVIPVICELNRNGVCRFSEMLHNIDGITTVMLTSVLKEMQNIGIVSRIQYNEVPLRVEYSLTDAGREVIPELFGLARWSSCNSSCGSGSSICGNSNCPAHSLQAINMQDETISSSLAGWDNDFIEAERNADHLEPGMDPIYKMQYIFEYTLKKNSDEGEEISRLKSIYYVIGEDRSAEFLSPERAAFKVLQRCIDNAREQGILIDYMTDQEIIYSFMSFKHGLSAYWELERGSFDIIHRNRNTIMHFFESFRK